MKSKKYFTPKKTLIFLPLLLLFFVCTFFIGYFTTEYYTQSYDNTEPVPSPTVADVVEEEIQFTEVDGITNILLLSTDARPGEKVSRSDSMMLLTIDNINKKLKVTSLLRDMLVEIENHGEEKLNHAFAYGESAKTIETIQNNFGIKIDNYIVVDFNGFKQVINSIDGVPIEIKNYEVKELNNYILDCGGTEKDLLTSAGTYNLNGSQALAYARIRMVGNGEYERTERQRALIQAAVNKFQDSSPITIATLLKDLLPYIKTNISIPNAIDYTLTALKIGNTSSFNIDQFRLPVDSVAQSALFESKGWVFIIDKSENAKALQEFIFNDNKNYKPNKSNLSSIVERCYANYGNMDEVLAESPMEDVDINEGYLYDYSRELDQEDFLEDNWTNKTDNTSTSIDDETYYDDLDYSDCDESWE